MSENSDREVILNKKKKAGGSISDLKTNYRVTVKEQHDRGRKTDTRPLEQRRSQKETHTSTANSFCSKL
jgi:hypothetical protein